MASLSAKQASAQSVTAQKSAADQPLAPAVTPVTAPFPVHVVYHQAIRRRRLQSSPSPLSTDHLPVLWVNRDASRSSTAPDNDAPARHATDGHDGSTDNVVRQRAAPRAALHAHSRRCSKSDHDRTGCKSVSGGRSGDIGTPARRLGRLRPTGLSGGDECSTCCDTPPACVPRHGVAHGAEATCQVRSAPCLPPMVRLAQRLR